MIAGVTAYGFLIVAAHSLDKTEYSALSVLWAMVFFAGPGFFLPLEQEVSRALAERRARGLGTGPLVRRAAFAGGAMSAALVAIAVAANGFLLRELFDDDVLLLVGLALGMVGYAAGHLSRGTFSGLARFRPYSWYLGGEGAARLILCVVLAFVGVETAGPFGLAVGAAPLVGVVLALRGQRDIVSDGPDAPWSELSAALGALLVASVLAQGLVNAGPLAVRLLASEAQEDEAGRFLAGVIVARIPLFLFQAVQAALLPKLSALAGAGRIGDFKDRFRRLIVTVAALGIVATIGAFAVGPQIVQLVFPSEFELGRRTVGLLAAGSAAYMIAIAMAQAVIALGGHVRMALSWVIGVAVFVVVTALGSDLFLRVELGLLAGSATTAGLMALTVAGRIRRGAAVDQSALYAALHEVPLEP